MGKQKIKKVVTEAKKDVEQIKLGLGFTPKNTAPHVHKGYRTDGNEEYTCFYADGSVLIMLEEFFTADLIKKGMAYSMRATDFDTVDAYCKVSGLNPQWIKELLLFSCSFKGEQVKTKMIDDIGSWTNDNGSITSKVA